DDSPRLRARASVRATPRTRVLRRCQPEKLAAEPADAIGDGEARGHALLRVIAVGAEDAERPVPELEPDAPVLAGRQELVRRLVGAGPDDLEGVLERAVVADLEADLAAPDEARRHRDAVVVESDAHDLGRVLRPRREHAQRRAADDGDRERA